MGGCIISDRIFLYFRFLGWGFEFFYVLGVVVYSDGLVGLVVGFVVYIGIVSRSDVVILVVSY